MEKIVSILAYFFPASLIKFKLLKKVEGKENLPKGNFIFAANHLSHIDWLLDGALMPPRKFTFIAQIDKMTGTKKLFRDALYWWAGTIPVDRNDRDSKRKALETAIGMLKKNYCLIVYPEGTRSRDGQLHDFKPGVGKLHLESGVPVVPVAHKGTYELMPPGQKFKAKKIVEVIIGKPLDFSKERQIAAQLDKSSEAYRGLCADIAKKTEAAVRQLLTR
jgi:1-acyl-sn-glycerol-3-phosphate acyltransferase